MFLYLQLYIKRCIQEPAIHIPVMKPLNWKKKKATGLFYLYLQLDNFHWKKPISKKQQMQPKSKQDC